MPSLIVKKIPTIFLTRHGETTFNDPSYVRLRGWLDLKLTNKGRQDAKNSGIKLAASGARLVVASDLHRTSETGKIIAEEIGARLVKDYAPRTWNTGALTGQVEKEVKPIIDFYVQHPQAQVPNGETYGEFLIRWGNAFRKYAQYVIDNPNNPIVLVTHHGNILIVEHLLKCLDVPVMDPETADTNIKPGEVLAVCFSKTIDNYKLVKL